MRSLVKSAAAFCIMSLAIPAAFGDPSLKEDGEDAPIVDYSDVRGIVGLAADRATLTQPPAPMKKINVTPDEIAKWQQYFDIVIVVNKASSAQTLQMFKKGEAQPILNTRVSTGTEEYKCHAVRDLDTGLVTQVRKIFTDTPTGYFVAGNLDIDHFSGAYDDAHMPYAVFLKDPTGVAEGIATHKAPGTSAEKLVGFRESHACIRLHLADSQEVFRRVLMTGGPFNINKDAYLNSRCNPTIVQSYCGEDFRRRNPGYHQWLEQSGAIGNSYPSTPLVPVVNRDGTLSDGQGHSFTLDEVNGRARMVPGYKTLYVVEDIETGTPTDRIFSYDDKGRLVSRKAQKTDISCPTPDELNGQAGRQCGLFGCW